MRVLYVCADAGIPLDGTKGAAVHVRQTIDALQRRGVEVTVLAARPGEPGAVRGLILPAGNLRSLDRGRSQGRLAAEMEALASARDLEARVPLSFGDVDVIYERYSLWSLAGAVLAERLAAPLVLEVNAPLVEEQARHRGISLFGIAGEIERFLARRADMVLCVSSALRERVARLRGSHEEVHLFPNSVDIERFRPGATSGQSSGGSEANDTVIIFTGSFKPWHGVLDLLEAFALLLNRREHCRLILVGDGPEQERLRKRVAELSIGSKVTLTGPVRHEEVPALLAAADIAVAPYPLLNDFYFSPMKLGEYLAAGLPVVATTCGDMDPLLRDGESALRVSPGDVTGLAGAILRLVDDPDLRRRLGRAGRRVAEEHLSLDAAAGRLVGLLHGLHERGSAARETMAR